MHWAIIKVNEQKVAFVECPVELEINNVNLLNQYLETEAFELNDNSSFEYTVQYGVVDTSTINGMFQQGEQIRFKVELVDNNTGELLGVYDDVVYDQNNHTDFENILYQVNTQGIGQRTVKLRLRIEENLNPEATMVDRLDTESVLGKNKRKEIKFQGEILPEEYALEQNYPNPFNPTTKIRYSIPSNVKGQKSNVILKVYDILGNEVATLVNEPKEPGYYEVEFSIGSFRNASELASGVYIYRLTAGNFVASRKMMLIK